MLRLSARSLRFLCAKATQQTPQLGRPPPPFDPATLTPEGRKVFDEVVADIRAEPILLFMKGEPERPRCGFSARAVNLLAHYGYEFLSYDVLSDPVIHGSARHVAEWPTFPQVFVKGEFIGGLDILQQLHQSGELATLLAASGAPRPDPAATAATAAAAAAAPSVAGEPGKK